ncbi:hypothetical protein EGW08_017119 [Elysia chlorotica]|uniref:C-type lectin domain-containing protein n=1 Tax=Elysia chlorotica TaxID=188477 RepID=A0A433T0M7_ELYCH|nr:hypothetical protein EGW08_017119 [Elysia chlorotica]
MQGEPVDISGVEDCVMILYQADSDKSSNKWRASECYMAYRFVCEVKAACNVHIYGKNCSVCSLHCRGPNNTCEESNGTCLLGCDMGYQGSKCEDKCANNTYGENCTNRCSVGCVGSTCNHVTGICEDGCYVGYQGNFCVTDHWKRATSTL